MPANQFGKVSVGITASTGGLSAALLQARNDLRGFAAFGSQIGKIGLATGFLAIAGAVRIVGAAVGAVLGSFSSFSQAASDLVEEQNRIDIVFGASAESVLAFAKSSASIGLATTEALRAAGTFGTLFNNIGLTEEQSAGMSIQMARLAADMASFNNVPVAESLRAIRSALVGEVEPIRRLGVVLNESTLRQRAFSMGLVDNVNTALTPAIRMQASYAEVLAQTAVQQGDAARTSGTLAGQQRQLTANLANLQTTIGEGFQPLFLALTSGLNQLMPALQAMGVIYAEAFAAGTAAMVESMNFVQMFTAAIRLLVGGVTILYGSFQILRAGFMLAAQQGSKMAVMLYRALDGVREVVAAVIVSIESNVRKALEFITFPIQGLVRGLAEIAHLAGNEGLAGSLLEAADNMATLSQRSSGFGEAIEGGLFEGMAQLAEDNAAYFGEQAAAGFSAGMENITNPFARFDAELDAQLNKAGEEAGIEFGEAAVRTIAGAAESLSAMLVDSSEAEKFRNAMLRGFDPRTANGADQQIAANTERTAEGVEGLPTQLAGSLGSQFGGATISV